MVSFLVLILFSLWLLWMISVMIGVLILFEVLINKVFIVFLIGRLCCLINFVMVFVLGVLIKVIVCVGVGCLIAGVIVLVFLMLVV